MFISSVGEMHSVNCSWTTKIDRPPWVDVTVCMCTPSTGVVNGMTTAVIGHIGRVAAGSVSINTALISRFVQRCVISQFCRPKWN